MFVAIGLRPSRLSRFRRGSDGHVCVPTLGRPQRVARRHRNAVSILISPFVDPGHVESHPVPSPVETQRCDGARRGGIKPIVDQFGRIGPGHVTPSTTISAMLLMMAVSTPSRRLTDVSEEGTANRVVHVELRTHGVLLIWEIMMFGVIHRGRSGWDRMGSIAIMRRA